MNLRLFQIESPHGNLAIMAGPRGIESLGDFAQSLRKAGVDLVVSLLTDGEIDELHLQGEPDACRAAGIEMLRLPIPDREVPKDLSLLHTILERMGAELKEGNSVVIHCRAGIGRSSMVAAVVLEKMGVDLTGAFQRISRARGCPVPDTEQQQRWAQRYVTMPPR